MSETLPAERHSGGPDVVGAVGDGEAGAGPNAAELSAAALAAGRPCPTCEFAVTNGWWGRIAPFRSHCRNCHRFSMPSMREGHCAGCCAHFATTEAFDYHLAPEGCRPPGELRRQDGKARLVARTRAQGVVWAVAYYGERPAHWGAAGAGPASEAEAEVEPDSE